MMRATLVLALVAGCACPSLVGPARFKNASIAWRVNDHADVPKTPASRPFAEKVYYVDANIYRPVAAALELPSPRHALDVNALDEVPDSSWFENRIGRRDVSIDELRRGPNKLEIDTSKITVIQSKTTGAAAGFVAIDGRGDRYVIKPDEKTAPIAESAADVAVQRLMWTIGYHVPENSVIYFARNQVELGKDAVVKDEFGNERPMLAKDLDAILQRGFVGRDGRFRALSSKYLPGKPIGGWPQSGVRADDPNDRIPHEHMRVLRGLYLFNSWLNQSDTKEGNTLDMWVEQDGHHFVKHFLVDFGKSFGLFAKLENREGNGYRYQTDYEYRLKSLLTFGLWVRPYEGTRTPDVPATGTFDVEHYDPSLWKATARYEPLQFTDDRDLVWAAKILARLTPAHIRAALEVGRYEDPRSLDYLTEVLVARQQKALKWVFGKAAALDRFTLADNKLCFEDLLLTLKLEPGMTAMTQYDATAYDYSGRELNWTRAVLAGSEGRSCLRDLPEGPDHGGYAIIRIVTWRDKRSIAPVEVHIAIEPNSRTPRIIGIHRQ